MEYSTLKHILVKLLNLKEKKRVALCHKEPLHTCQRC